MILEALCDIVEKFQIGSNIITKLTLRKELIMRDKNNWVELVGTIGEDIRLSYGNQFYTCYKTVLYVQRTSGAIDEIPIFIDERNLKQCDAHKDSKVSVEGRVQRRSEWDEKKQGYHVTLYVQVTEMKVVPDTEPDKNEVFLSGTICGDPILRTTPKGKMIADFSIICTRASGWKSYRIWCIAWGSAAYSISEKCEGDRVAFYGRFQSRYYTKVLENGEEEQRITYEVSSMKLVE